MIDMPSNAFVGFGGGADGLGRDTPFRFRSWAGQVGIDDGAFYLPVLLNFPEAMTAYS
jgi:hypothetical protein